MTAPAAAVSVRPEDMRQKTDAGFSETLLKRIDLTGKEEYEVCDDDVACEATNHSFVFVILKAQETKEGFTMTELVFILDRSGSMSGLESDTIGGFNSMLTKQKQEPGECLVSTVLFDTETEVIHDRVPLGNVPNLSEKEYFVRGCTALLDAMGGAIHHIGNVHKYARPEDRPERTLFVITTDGLENASRRYDYEKVKAMIERQREKYGWEFIFLGANIDAAKEAARFGIGADHAVRYQCDSEGTALNFEVISEAVACARAAMPLQSSWKDRIEADFKKRGKKP